MRPGEIDHRGRVWHRCTVCGDSKKLGHAHQIQDTKGRTYCFRCGASGHVSFAEYLSQGVATPRGLTENPELVAACGERWCALPQYQPVGRAGVVAFEMRSPQGEHVGWHYKQGGKSTSVGQVGLGYVPSKLGSSKQEPLVVVEGPFDVLTTNEVCVFGMLNASSLARFRLQYVWLYPDPDCLDTVSKRRGFLQTVARAREQLVFVQGVVVANGDNDVATQKTRYSLEQIREEGYQCSYYNV